ncbi:hypothetical protein Ctob_001019 [Chrysochromulina tobinii]|uniref:Uncharacterized protein n=1 Tax=Chrysochromulina tobinii TaxID=1460289 RepID=A0A0M0JAX2_9EUKA|nr:hypothetical protein Ctob_001019 [Chrysochromulina tobinii]|eukprot:KOO23368.1 hypothetical protein Ctob_001019 [Chrysochromulina sp. CCMP291]
MTADCLPHQARSARARRRCTGCAGTQRPSRRTTSAWCATRGRRASCRASRVCARRSRRRARRRRPSALRAAAVRRALGSRR